MGIGSRFRYGVAAVAVVVSVTGCTTEYHGYDSGIDDALWRQIASFKDPLTPSIYGPLEETIGILHELDPAAYPAAIDDPADYLAGIPVPRWDGTDASLAELDLADGGAVLYDESAVDGVAAFSIFVASGLRPGASRDGGGWFDGPSEVYTCYGFEVDFDAASPPFADRTTFDACPSELVELLAPDAAFADVDVFNG